METSAIAIGWPPYSVIAGLGRATHDHPAQCMLR